MRHRSVCRGAQQVPVVIVVIVIDCRVLLPAASNPSNTVWQEWGGLVHRVATSLLTVDRGRVTYRIWPGRCRRREGHWPELAAPRRRVWWRTCVRARSCSEVRGTGAPFASRWTPWRARPPRRRPISQCLRSTPPSSRTRRVLFLERQHEKTARRYIENKFQTKRWIIHGAWRRVNERIGFNDLINISEFQDESLQ